MKLFISYSRDDKAWVYELWRALRDELHHDAWIDRRLVAASDWWGTICENIKNCECFIYIMTPKAIDSIYCMGELNYAIALNKPILPLMLKPCSYPAVLSAKRVQYDTLNDEMSIDKVLVRFGTALSKIREDMWQGKYPAREAEQPEVPSPSNNAEQVFEVFTAAEEAAAEGNFSLAETLFAQVQGIDPDGLGEAAKERLQEIKYERERHRAYVQIAKLANNLQTLKGAQAAWRTFKTKYSSDYDPDNLIAILEAKPVPPPPDKAPSPSFGEGVGGEVKKLLPAPFTWIEIPAGEVTLITEKGWLKNYIPEGGKQTFKVPAFAIAKYPCTNAQFALFVAAGGYRDKQWWTDAGWEAREKEKWLEPRYWQDAKWNRADYPVVGVSWYEAMAFCSWVSAQSSEAVLLPTEQQWQRAAQAMPDGRDSGYAYPWGNKWDGKKCNNSVKPEDSNETTPVRYYEGKGDSPCGVVDMAGNVWEWCLTDYETGMTDKNVSSKQRVLRGGSWGDGNSGDFRADYRDRGNSDFWYYDRGFRFARSYK